MYLPMELGRVSTESFHEDGGKVALCDEGGYKVLI